MPHTVLRLSECSPNIETTFHSLRVTVRHVKLTHSWCVLLLQSFGIYQPITGEALTPAKAFTTLTLFSLLGGPLIMIPGALYSWTSCYISTKRLHKFFSSAEVENESDAGSDGDLLDTTLEDGADDGGVLVHQDNPPISVHNGFAISWFRARLCELIGREVSCVRVPVWTIN